jgi:hypothetical protein
VHPFEQRPVFTPQISHVSYQFKAELRQAIQEAGKAHRCEGRGWLNDEKVTATTQDARCMGEIRQ